MASGFSDQCSVAVSNTYNTTGTLTRSNLAALTPTTMKALFMPSANVWVENGALLRHQIEMKACGTRRSALYDWIMSSNKPGQSALVNKRNVAKGPSMIEPFIVGRQMSVINDDHWYITGNLDKTAYDAQGGSETLTGTNTADARFITVKSSFSSTLPVDGDFASGSLTVNPRFLPGKRIFVFSKNSSTGAAQITQLKVLQSGVNADDTAAIDIECVQEQNTSGEIASDATATTGLVVIGPNNVNNVESWCYNMVNTNAVKHVPFWYQTMRTARSIDSEYRKIFGSLMADNKWYATFQDLPLAERNRQDEARFQREFLNAFFWGTAISSNQTLANWGSLDKIYPVTGASVDPGTGSNVYPIAYRANMIGVVPQLQACGQVSDSAGVPLEIRTFLETTIYEIFRARESQGRPSRSIDIYTSQSVADQFMSAFMKYSEEKVGDTARIQAEGEVWGFPYRSFKLYYPQGVTVNIITDNWFDDQASAHTSANASNASLGNALYVLDLGSGGTIYPAVLGSSRKQYTSGQIDDLAKIDKTFSCAMDNVTIERTLTSQTVTAIVECPKNSIIVHNFSAIQHTAA